MNEMIDPEGFVLIGGASSRMGSDKAKMTIAGDMLFEHSAAALRVVCADRVTLVGKIGGELISDLPVIDDVTMDPVETIRAPLIGVYSAFMHAKTPWIAILACDLPFVSSDLMIKLSTFCSEKTDAVVPVQPDGTPQPLCGFYHREKCTTAASKMLKRGDLKLQRFLASIRTRYIAFDEIADLEGATNLFLNVNKPEDHITACEILRGKKRVGR